MAQSPARTFLDELLDARLLVRTTVQGVYGRGETFERVRLGLDALVTRTAAPEAPEVMAFPPLLPRHQFERSGYLANFPHLAGTVFGFDGDEQAAAHQHELAIRHEDWSEFQTMADLVLTPAACYSLYPAVAQRGALPAEGALLDTGDAYVFRREPSENPTRMQMFHMREIVRIAPRDAVLEWRERWRRGATELLRGLGLDVELAQANDPFFGRSGRLMASAQREQDLKWELVVPVGGTPTAIASSNYHMDHLAQTYDLRTADGELAHTSCTAFGEERVTLALLSTHGLDPAAWPAEVAAQLGL